MRKARLNIDVLYRFLEENCFGRKNAMKVDWIAKRFQTNGRSITLARHELVVARGLLICGAKEEPYGLYLPSTDSEKKRYVNQISAEVREICIFGRAIERAPLPARARKVSQGVLFDG